MSAGSPSGRKRARTADAGGDESKASGTAKAPLLHSYWRSSCSYRVRIVMAIKGIEYEYKAVSLLKGDHLTDDFAANVNSMKSLPALEIDGHILTASPAIIEYLEETRPEPALLPATPYERCLARAIASDIGADIQPVQNLRVLRAVMGFFDAADEKTKQKLAWGKRWIASGFEAVEAKLAKCAGKYCVGDQLTIADAFLVPQVYNARRFKVDMTKFPTISRVTATLEALPAFKKAHPSAMPDAA